MLTLPDEEGDWNGLEVETVPVPRSPEPDGTSGNVRYTQSKGQCSWILYLVPVPKCLDLFLVPSSQRSILVPGS